MSIKPCPCGSAAAFDACCGPVLAGTGSAATAVELMRSRFTAFALGDADHLLASWAAESRPEQLHIDPRQRWTRLEIVDVVDGRQLDTAGVVEFRAHYEVDGTPGMVHERSNFVRARGRWVYVDGAAGG